MKLTNEAQKTIFVVWNGGCTHTEINAVRFIGKLLGKSGNDINGNFAGNAQQL